MKKILVSECLFGGRAVRYDGASFPTEHPVFVKWKNEGRLIPICPEVFGGLKIPRPEAQRKNRFVVTNTGLDVTEEYKTGAKEALRLAKENEVVFAVMKESSPSCGSNKIYDGSFTNTKMTGKGFTVEILEKEGFIVFSENEIEEAEKFLSKLEGQ